MASAAVLPATPFSTPAKRVSPHIRRIQSSIKWSRHSTSDELDKPFTVPSNDRYSHAHPELPRWDNTTGVGCKHVLDHAPFSLWDPEDHGFRTPTKEELHWIDKQFNNESLWFEDHRFVIETNSPPDPVPLTIAACPAYFVPPGMAPKSLVGSTALSNPRLLDPVPHIRLRNNQTPSRSDMNNITEALLKLVDIQEIVFFPKTIMVRLVQSDHVHKRASLPGTVAGQPTTYQQSTSSLLTSMRNRARERIIDPQEILPDGTQCLDDTDYLRHAAWEKLTPGMRLSCGNWASSAGVRVRKGAEEYVTMAHHASLGERDVYHPDITGHHIGEIVDRREELDLALIRLDPSVKQKFTNSLNFLATAPRFLLEQDDVTLFTWLEVEGMSTGMVFLQLVGMGLSCPPRPDGHPKMPVHKWSALDVLEIHGATNERLVDGMCGAPLVRPDGGVAGFFHLAQGDYAITWCLDDLVAEGWQLVC